MRGQGTGKIHLGAEGVDGGYVDSSNPLPVTNFSIEVAKGNVTGSRIYKIPGFHEADVETSQLGDVSLIPNVVVLPVPGAGGGFPCRQDCSRADA